MDDIVPFCSLDEAVVKRVMDYGADLELVSTGARAYIHISRLNNDFIRPPLTKFLSVGEILPVVIGRFDVKHNCWEVSHKDVRRLHETLALPGDACTAIVQHATELGCTLLCQETRLSLLPPRHAWSRYRVLLESGRLAEGKSIDVVFGRTTSGSSTLTVHLPRVRADISNSVYQAEVILLRPRYIKKKHKLQSVMYAQIDGVCIARIDVSELLDVEQAYPIGSQVPIRLNKIDDFTGLIEASLVWELTKFSSPVFPEIGQVVTSVVTWMSPYGAHCLLDDRVIAFMHKSTVLGSISEDLDKYLHPGDIVEVKVLDKLDSLRGTNQVGFVKRIERFIEAPTEESVLLDLAAVRRIGATGGFARDAGFRWSVLEAYDHYCCVCGNRYAVGDATAMEAAHVVPRSNRGSNRLENALCLCPTHHWSFDKGLVTIDDDFLVRIADVVLASGNEGKWLAEFHGKAAHLEANAPISRLALAWHRRNIFLDK